MIKVLNSKEMVAIAGGYWMFCKCPDGYKYACGAGAASGDWDSSSPQEVEDHCTALGHQLPPTCSCLDYNDKPFPGPDVKTMNACWEYCCQTNDIYHAAKFGKYPRDC